MERQLSRAIGLTTLLTLVTVSPAFADHNPLEDDAYFTTVFAPLVATLPAWLVLGILPAIILALLVAATYWAWRSGVDAREQAAKDNP